MKFCLVKRRRDLSISLSCLYLLSTNNRKLLLLKKLSVVEFFEGEIIRRKKKNDTIPPSHDLFPPMENGKKVMLRHDSVFYSSS